MANQIASGKVLRYANATGSAIASGAIVLLPGGKIAVALADIPDGEAGSIQICGVFPVTKLSTDAVTQGAKLYWDNTNKRLTVTVGSNTYAGDAYTVSNAGETTVEIILNGIPD